MENVTGFNLKWPCRHINRPALANKGEWIEIRKQKNKLPTARLRTWVLYPRFNGDLSSNLINIFDPSHTDLGSWKDASWADAASPQPNFRFYHNKSTTYTEQGGTEVHRPAGRQIGSIWGFPLFNVGPNGETDMDDKKHFNANNNIHTLWPAFGSCISKVTKDTDGKEDISGNETMLVNIGNERNIIVLDFAGYDEGNDKKKYAKIANNLTFPLAGQEFYIVLRVKSGHERLVPDTGPLSFTNPNGKHFWSNLLKTDGSYHNTFARATQFYSLVEYTYECDIIGPKPMLDLTLDYFSFIGSNTQYGKLFGSGGMGIWVNGGESTKKLAIPRKPPYSNNNNSENANSYTTDISINIITGIKYEGPTNTSINQLNRMDTDYIYATLSSEASSNTNPVTFSNARQMLMYPNNSNTNVIDGSNNNYVSGTSFSRIIGGFASDMLRSEYLTDVSGGYYGGNYVPDTSWNKTKKTATEGWQWDINLLKSGGENKWPGNLSNLKSYNLNNILWCSLMSPKKIPVQNIVANADDAKTCRYITNFIDISGTYSIGGGYGRYTNTLDMPRSSIKPYYSSVSNNNCTSINDYDVTSSNIQYLDSSGSVLPDGSEEFGNVRSLGEVGHYKIYYKLLIPPVKNCSITYSFGKNNNSKITFFREKDMSGNPNPARPIGNSSWGAYESSVWANRDSESITFTWKPGQTDIKTLILTDVASGTSNHAADISFNDGTLNSLMTSTDYDISCNIFQPIFTSIDDNGNLVSRDDNPYSVKTFDTNNKNLQYYDISYIPQNYQPYRYIDIDKVFINSNNSCEADYYWYRFKASWPGPFWDGYGNGPFVKINETLKYNNIKVFARQGGSYDITSGVFTPTPIDGTNTKLPPAIFIDPSNTKIVDEINIDILNTVADLSYSVISADLTQAASTQIAQEEIAIFSKPIGDILTNTQFGYSFNPSEDWVTSLTLFPQQSNITFYEPKSISEKNNFIPDYWRLPEKVNKLRKDAQIGTISYTTNYGYFAKWQNQVTTTAVFDILNIILKGVKDSTGTKSEIGGLLMNSNKNSIKWSAVDTTGTLITGDIIFEVQGGTNLPDGSTLAQRPIVVQLISISTGPFGSSAINYIGDTAGGTNSGIKNPNYVVNTILPNTMRQGNNNTNNNNSTGTNFPNTTTKSYNGLYYITITGWKEDPVFSPPRQNPFFNGISISPSPLSTLLVDISSVVQTNPKPFDMIAENNRSVIIRWSGFSFSEDVSWNTFPVGQNGDIEWTISRYNLSTGKSINKYTGTIPFNLSTKEYTWIDNDVIVYEKYNWTVTGTYKWFGITKLIANSAIPTLPVPGFTTVNCFICKNNRFKYGRFNTTSTNLKLYAPLLINTKEGQVDKFGNKVCGGGCSDPNNPSLQLFSSGSRISSSNNIYANTTNQLSKKETYVLLAKSRFRPSR